VEEQCAVGGYYHCDFVVAWSWKGDQTGGVGMKNRVMKNFILTVIATSDDIHSTFPFCDFDVRLDYSVH